MIEIVGVRFKIVGKVYYFTPGELKLTKGMNVIVETSRGVEIGEIVIANCEISEEQCSQPVKQVLRIATNEDLLHLEDNKKKEKEAIEVCNQKIKSHKLDMKLVDVEYTFDNSKILFYFMSDGRVDFRELVKDLANVFKVRIELRQIGVRDEAKILGGLGICGQQLCCSRFLNDFQPVSIKMAKEQGLSLNSSKISGTCGRLMCCLKYEQNTYEALIKTIPGKGSIVDTPAGTGTVIDASPLKGTVKVRLDSGEAALKVFTCDEVKILKNVEIKTDVNDIDIMDEIL